MEYKIIGLSKGGEVLVDEADFDYLNQWKWFAHQGYVVRKEKGKGILMHRVIMDTPKGLQTDHINHDGFDNRRTNLRIVTQRQNLFNQRLYKNNTSGFKGVSRYSRTGKWKAQIQVNGFRKGLGYFRTAVQAAMAYDLWAKDLYGEHAQLNFI